ncbi:MAG: transposase [Ruminococcus sp.]|nr:transposase [Ruminococcus sp.]
MQIKMDRGPVIVNETTHRPIDVLEGRTSEEVKKWLAENKHIRSVTRDCSGAYSTALQEILPNCIQIVDKFHLYKNLIDTVTSVINASLPVRITKNLYS